MAQIHEMMAFDLLKAGRSREQIKELLRKKLNITENVINISITRASAILVEKHPEFRKVI